MRLVVNGTEHDLGDVEPSLAGHKKPHARIPMGNLDEHFPTLLEEEGVIPSGAAESDGGLVADDSPEFRGRLVGHPPADEPDDDHERAQRGPDHQEPGLPERPVPAVGVDPGPL